MNFAVSFVFISVMLSPSLSHAEDMHDHDSMNSTSGIEALSPELRKLLSKEMLAIQDGMMSIIPAYAAGNWDEIENIAHKMENSYILSQSLTDEQVKELHSSLPDLSTTLVQPVPY